MKKFLIYMTLAVFLFCMMPLSSLAEGSDPSYDEGSKTVTATFDVVTIGESRTWDFEYNDEWFSRPATVYNHKLARVSFGVAISTSRPSFDEAAADDPSLHIKDFLGQMGFKDLRSDDYDKNPSIYTISTVMGYKVMHDELGPYIMLAVGVCGGGYRNEWLSNVTVGDGVLHEGFNAAASLIYDRIHGYIASHHLYGQRFKAWVSGYSRAAAVSNILGTKLVDDDLFEEKDVFCYTFATPRTTRDVKRGEYKNIFNICGKMDPVTQVPFADWGYGRFGTTLYTPSQETDSNYLELATEADKAYQKAEGLNFWNNVEWDTKLRLLLNYLIKLCPTAEVYSAQMQKNIVNILADKSISNIMTQLMEIAENKELINEENQDEANSLLTFLSYTIYNYFTQSDIDAKYRNEKASAMANLVHEHMPDVYLAWLYASDDPTKLYSENMNYLRIVVAGNADVAVYGGEDHGTLIKAMDSHGKELAEFSKDGTATDTSTNGSIFMGRKRSSTIILLPQDEEYLLAITSNRDQKVEVHSIKLLSGRTNGRFSKLNYINMKKGQIETILSTRYGDLDGGDIVVGDTFDIVDISGNSTTDYALSLERNNILNLNWRQMVMIAFSLPVILLCLLGMFVAWMAGGAVLMRQRRRGVVEKNVRYDKRPAFFIFAIIALFMMQEVLFWLMPQYLMERSIIKALIGICLLALCYQGYNRQPSKLSLALLFSLIVFVAADIIINFNFGLAMALFALGHVILAINFMLFDRPEKWQWVFWIIASLIAVTAIYFIATPLGDIRYPMMGYGVILMMLFTMSLTLPKKIRIGSILFLISDVFLFVNEIRNASLFSHILALGIFYISLGCYAYGTRFKVTKVIEERPDDDDDNVRSTELVF